MGRLFHEPGVSMDVIGGVADAFVVAEYEAADQGMPENFWLFACNNRMAL